MPKLTLRAAKSKCLIIGVAGRSCSGKSTVVKALEARYKGRVIHICQDKFFKKQAKNWETPDALRMDRLSYSIKKLKNGESTHIPSHRWTELFDREIRPHEVIIVEGYLLFVDKTLNKLFDKKIWVEVSDANVLFRRLKRDGHTKGVDYILNQVIPESKRYEGLQKQEADIIIDGNKSEQAVLRDLGGYIKKWHKNQA